VVPEREDVTWVRPEDLLPVAAWAAVLPLETRRVWWPDCFATAVTAVANRTNADRHQNLPALPSESTLPHPFCFCVIEDAFIFFL